MFGRGIGSAGLSGLCTTGAGIAGSVLTRLRAAGDAIGQHDPAIGRVLRLLIGRNESGRLLLHVRGWIVRIDRGHARRRGADAGEGRRVTSHAEAKCETGKRKTTHGSSREEVPQW